VAFDELYEKVHEVDGQLAKMKVEEDMKKEIKKLQRYR
jgi:CCR4-NOT transcriptional regulation complex NOT5 subunit